VTSPQLDHPQTESVRLEARLDPLEIGRFPSAEEQPFAAQLRLPAAVPHSRNDTEIARQDRLAYIVSVSPVSRRTA
jgi:hypothetical protein